MQIWFHIDVNSAFLSWTALDLLNAGSHEDIREIPAIIGGDIHKRHGVVLAKSTSAKAFGIRTGEPVTDAYKKCPYLKNYPPNHHRYKAYSQKLMKLLGTYSPEIIQYSIDECFMRYIPSEPAGDEQEIRRMSVSAAKEIKDRIRQELKFTVNIGISYNKLLAKMASDFEKPDKVHTLFPDEIRKKMWPLPAGELFMVGPSTADRLRLLGIKTIGDLACTNPEILTSHLKSHGKMIWEYANGIEGAEIDGRAKNENKGIGNMTTLSSDVSDKKEIFKILRELAEKVARRLRQSKVLAGLVCVEIKYYNFKSATHQTQLLTPSNGSSDLYQAACRLFEECWSGEPVRLLGIRTSKLCTAQEQQLNLFDMEKSEKMLKLDQALDAIRGRYGENAVVRGSRMKAEKLGWEQEIPDEDFNHMSRGKRHE